jgi:hypothetical protein
MNSRRYIFIFLLSFEITALFSQQLSHQVLVPVAGVASQSSLNYAQTGGETAVEIIAGSGFVLSQGFQQPGILSLPVKEKPEGTGIKVYPNPASDLLKVEFFSDEGRSFVVDILNVAATVLLSERINFPVKNWFVREINIEGLMKGTYLVRVVSHDGFINRSFIIQKQ